MTPYETLAIPAHASEEDIRAAYVDKVKQFPPDRSPEQFEEIRNAYETLRDPRKRARALLLDTSFTAPLVALIDGQKSRRIFAGPHCWLEVLKTK